MPSTEPELPGVRTEAAESGVRREVLDQPAGAVDVAAGQFLGAGGVIVLPLAVGPAPASGRGDPFWKA